MHDFFATTILAAARGGSGGLTEAELLARYPALAATAATLFALGLTCDVYLLLRLALTRDASRSRRVSLLKITAKPWGLPELSTATSALVGVLIVFVFAGRLAGLGKPDALPVVLAIEVALRIGALAAFVWWFRRLRVNWGQAFGLRPAAILPAIFDGVMFYLAILPPFAVVVALQSKLLDALRIHPVPQPIADLFVTSNSTWVVSLLVALALVAAPLFEETLFRGFAYPVLKQRWGAWRAMAAVAVVFALIHFHAPSFIPLFALACGFGLAYEWSGSLATPITVHALFNGANVAMLLYARIHS